MGNPERSGVEIAQSRVNKALGVGRRVTLLGGFGSTEVVHGVVNLFDGVDGSDVLQIGAGAVAIAGAWLLHIGNEQDVVHELRTAINHLAPEDPPDNP